MSEPQADPRVVHIVLFRWKPDAAGPAIAAAVEGIRRLRDQIPGIVSLEIGPDFSERSQGYQHGLVVTFESRAALETYGPHPAHLRVVSELIQPISDGVLALDFEAR